VRNLSKPIRHREVTAARLAAFEILEKIETERAFSSVLLPAAEENLAPLDRALCHALVLGVVRRKSYLDALIKHFSGKKIGKLDLPVVLALRLGLFQLRFLTKIPPRAAVNESVNLMHAKNLRSAAGFANAVLRESLRQTKFNPIEAAREPLDKLVLETSHPRWLLEKWVEQFGFDDARALARANNETPDTAFRLTNPQDDGGVLEELKRFNIEFIESKITKGAFRVSKTGAKLRRLAEDGRIYFQDEASQLVAETVDLQPEESFLDVCAAPGSKTTQLRNSDGGLRNDKLFVAGDLRFNRIRVLRETARKFAAKKIEIVQYDAASSLPFHDASFDCVLVDAPCSGTGTIRHNPEIRWHLRAEDFNDLQTRQAAILHNAARAVRAGGRLVYSTCSLEPEENETVAERFLLENADFKKAQIALPPPFLTADGFARTFPPRDDADGFFIAVFEKNS
jgi:16S rRNA (cytosine967-C5)-methyltransferase